MDINDKASEKHADLFYKEGMKYDWRQNESPSSATIARANFQQATAMGHTKAIRALAHLIFEGRGGSQDKDQALLLLWTAFLRGDHDSLEELADMLGSYANTETNPVVSENASKAANQIEVVIDQLNRVKFFIQTLRSESPNTEIGSDK